MAICSQSLSSILPGSWPSAGILQVIALGRPRKGVGIAILCGLEIVGTDWHQSGGLNR